MRIRVEWRRLVHYPFLAAVYPVLALAAANTDDVTHARLLVLPLLISVGVAGLVWCVARPFIRDPDRRGLLVLVGVLCFAGYGHWERELARSSFVDLHYVGLTLPIWLSATAWCASLVIRMRRSVPGVTRFLNVMGLVMLVFPTVTLVRAAAREPVDPLPLEIDAQDAEGTAPPDVYFILVDEYSSGRSLASLYGYDNSRFEDSLRERGFAVPRAAHANYIHTFLSLASMLNWSYLDDSLTGLGEARNDRRTLYPWIESSRAFRFFKQQGYEFLFLGSAYEPTRFNRHADVVVPEQARWIGEFQQVWAGTTLLIRSRWLNCLLSCRAWQLRHESSDVMTFRFDWLEQIARPTSRPRFIFAHLLIPHDPYLFHADCRPRNPSFWVGHQVEEPSDLAKQVYAEQVACVNRRLLGVVDSIRARSSRPPIILIQSDHGNGMLGWPYSSPGEMSKARIADRLGVFAAYYLPGPDAPHVPDTIEPIDVFPLVLNHYFGTDLPFQGGRSYWSDWETPYAFMRMR